eukprot:g751.t1
MDHFDSDLKSQKELDWLGIHHIGVLCKDLETSIKFYQDLLGFDINPSRPNEKFWFRGAWFWVGHNMIHIMEKDNPDPIEGRPEYGGEDRHVCLGIKEIEPLIVKLKNANIPFQHAMDGRSAIFFRDPDGNTIEAYETEEWNQ